MFAFSAPDTASRPFAEWPAAITCGGRPRLAAPMVDVGTARLDRHRHTKVPTQRNGGRPVGPEELRVDDVEGKIVAQPGQRPGQRAHHHRGVITPRPAGQMHETRPVHDKPPPRL